ARNTVCPALAGLVLSARQHTHRVDRRAVTPDLEMQLGTKSARRAYGSNFLATLYLLPFADQHRLVVRIGAQPALVVLDDQQVAITGQSVATIHHNTVCGGGHWITFAPPKGDAMLPDLVGRIMTGDAAGGRPLPVDRPGRYSGCRFRSRPAGYRL